MPYFGATRAAIGGGGGSGEGLLLAVPFAAALDLVTTVPGTAVSRSLQGIGVNKTAAKAAGVVAGTATLAATGVAAYALYEELDKKNTFSLDNKKA